MPKAKTNERLRAERKRWRLTQVELAVLTKLKSRSFISQIERSIRKPTLEFALACETVFGKPIRKLFPSLSNHVEERVIRNAGLLHHALINKTGSSAVEKRKLFGKLMDDGPDNSQV